ncbi:MAG: class I fructose-bisphosphate aldolase [Bacteroidota bacterium]
MSEDPFEIDITSIGHLIGQITDIRLNRAADLRAFAQARTRRERLTTDGKLVILAADHPARMVTGALDNPVGLADRRQYLGRILRVLTGGGVDGLMGTPDVIEEVLAADILHVESGQPSFLQNKLLVGCMNRGGLSGTAFDMLDSYTAYDAAGLAAMNLDAAKLMFRLEPEEPDCAQTILWSSQAVNACLDHSLPVFVEPLMVKKQGSKYVVQRDAENQMRICGVASALGRSSLNTWLKLPFGPDYDRVASSTTCPILMLGGEAVADPMPLLRDMETGMQAGANVRGALIGRNVLFPGNRDPLLMARAVSRIVHEGVAAEAAMQE